MILSFDCLFIGTGDIVLWNLEIDKNNMKFLKHEGNVINISAITELPYYLKNDQFLDIQASMKTNNNQSERSTPNSKKKSSNNAKVSEINE